jgi:hypothetical protein
MSQQTNNILDMVKTNKRKKTTLQTKNIALLFEGAAYSLSSFLFFFFIFLLKPPTFVEEQPQPPEQHSEIDPFLSNALNNPRDRFTILKLEKDLGAFLSDTRYGFVGPLFFGSFSPINVLSFSFMHLFSRVRLDFPPMTSYQRLIVHRVAQHFKLGHTVVDFDGARRAIILFKTPETKP